MNISMKKKVGLILAGTVLAGSLVACGDSPTATTTSATSGAAGAAPTTSASTTAAMTTSASTTVAMTTSAATTAAMTSASTTTAAMTTAATTSSSSASTTAAMTTDASMTTSSAMTTSAAMTTDAAMTTSASGTSTTAAGSPAAAGKASTTPGGVPAYSGATQLQLPANLEASLAQSLGTSSKVQNVEYSVYSSADDAAKIKAYYTDYLSKNGWQDVISQVNGQSSLTQIESAGGFALAYYNSSQTEGITAIGLPAALAANLQIPNTPSTGTVVIVIAGKSDLNSFLGK